MAVDYELDRRLRTITVYNFVLALCLGAPAGSRGPSIIVPFAIIPAAFSAALGCTALGGYLKRPCVAIPLDAILTAAYVGLMIPTWVILASAGARDRTCNSGGLMLATYATVPIIINMVIHAYCVTRHLPLSGSRSQAVCPNCQHEHEVRHKFFHPSSTIYARSTIPSTIYTPDDDDEDDQSIARDYDDTPTIRRESSDIDGSTLFAGEGRTLLNHPPAYQAKAGGNV